MIIRTFIALAAFGLSTSSAMALQEVIPAEGQNAFVKISAKETTRIYLDGGKIRSIIGTDGELTVEKDEERGQIFVRPTIQGKPVNLRVIAASGATYNLVMQPVDIPQEDIVIREPASFKAALNDASKSKRTASSGTAVKQVRSLVSAMAQDEPPTTVDVKEIKQEFSLWDGTKFVMTSVYTERDLVGEKYRLTNTGKALIRIVEQEFYRKGVVAVAIENMQLDPGQSTNIYVVRSN